MPARAGLALIPRAATEGFAFNMAACLVALLHQLDRFAQRPVVTSGTVDTTLYEQATPNS